MVCYRHRVFFTRYCFGKIVKKLLEIPGWKFETSVFYTIRGWAKSPQSIVHGVVNCFTCIQYHLHKLHSFLFKNCRVSFGMSRHKKVFCSVGYIFTEVAVKSFSHLPLCIQLDPMFGLGPLSINFSLVQATFSVHENTTPCSHEHIIYKGT